MCSAYLLVNLFIRILPMNCKYIKNVPTGKHGMLCSWHVTCNCFLFYLLRALAPGVHSITSLTPISNGGGAFPYHYPTLFHETRLLKNAPTRDASPPLEFAFGGCALR